MSIRKRPTKSKPRARKPATWTAEGWTDSESREARRKKNEADSKLGIFPMYCEPCGAAGHLWEDNREQYPSGKWISTFRCAECGKLTHVTTPKGFTYGKALKAKKARK